MPEKKIHKNCGGRVLESESIRKGVEYDLICQKCGEHLYKEEVKFEEVKE